MSTDQRDEHSGLEGDAGPPRPIDHAIDLTSAVPVAADREAPARVGSAVVDLDGTAATAPATAAQVIAGPPARSPWSIAWRRLRRDRVALAGAVFIALLVVFALAAPVTESITGHKKNAQNIAKGLDVNNVPVFPGVNGYVLGADQIGEDQLVQLAYGARTSLTVGLVATFLTMVTALIFGILAGFYGGFVDSLVSRLIDVIAAFPFLVFAIAMSVVIGASLGVVIFVIALFSWFYPARIFRSDILALREREFVEAARMIGASNLRIMRTHLLPHLVGPLIVYSTLLVASAITFEAALSYLGFGLPPDVPSWGRMINNAVQSGRYTLDPWMMLIPGTMLFMTVLAFNLLGDGLRDALDPRGGGDN